MDPELPQQYLPPTTTSRQRRRRIETNSTSMKSSNRVQRVQRPRAETIRPQEHRVQLEVKILQRAMIELKQETTKKLKFNIITTQP